MAPTATTVPVEQDSSAARLEAAEQLPETLNPESLRKYFTLTETDLQEVAVCRGVVNKLGFAVQLCTLRWQGYFLGDTRGLPAPVLESIAPQLGLSQLRFFCLAIRNQAIFGVAIGQWPTQR
jgi:hypothetical protein